MNKKRIGMLAALLAVIAILALVLYTAPPVSAADDAQLTVTAALPAVGTSNTTASLDLGVAGPALVWKHAVVKAAIPAIPTFTNAQEVLRFKLQDSADGTTFAFTVPLVEFDWPGTTNYIAAGATNAGTIATNCLLPIPPQIRRYLRLQQTTPTNVATLTSTTNSFSVTVP